MSPISTHMMLILPSDYKKIWKEKYEDAKKSPGPGVRKTKAGFQIYRAFGFMRASGDAPYLRFAEIRKTSGRVGEHRYRYLEDIGSITLTEDYTSQKRWYKAMVAYNDRGMKTGKPPVEFLYFFIDPWILDRLVRVAGKNK